MLQIKKEFESEVWKKRRAIVGGRTARRAVSVSSAVGTWVDLAEETLSGDRDTLYETPSRIIKAESSRSFSASR